MDRKALRTGFFLLGLVCVLSLIVYGTWMWWGNDPLTTVPGLPGAPGVPPEPGPPPATPPDTTPEPSRIAIPRPAARSVDEPVDEPLEDASETDPLPEEDTGSTIPVPVGGGEELGRVLQDAIGDVQPALIDCLAGWQEAQPDVFTGRVVFAFDLDQEGVRGMDVLDVESVPESTLTCLGDVLWEDVDWPTVETPTEVSWPVQVSVRPDEGEGG